MRLTEEDMQLRRETMIHTAFCLFCKHGIENVTLLQIAQIAQVGENTLYRYFGNKENLVLEAFILLWDTIMRNVEQIVESTPNYDALTGYGQMRVWLGSFHRLYQIDKAFVLFSYEAKLYLLRHNITLDQVQQDILTQSLRASCLTALNKGKADGSIPVKEDSEDLFYAIWGSILGYIVKIVIFGKLFDGDSPWEDGYQVMERGILSALSSGWDPPV